MKKIGISLDSCKLEFRIINYSEPLPRSNGLKISAIGKNNDIKLFLPESNYSSLLKISLSDVLIDGESDNINGLINDYNSWSIISIDIKKPEAKILVNNKIACKMEYNESLGNLTGFNIWFIGGGAIDYVRCYDQNRDLYYSEEFNNK